MSYEHPEWDQTELNKISNEIKKIKKEKQTIEEEIQRKLQENVDLEERAIFRLQEKNEIRQDIQVKSGRVYGDPLVILD